MYVMVCTILNIAHAAKVVNRYISHLGKQQWEVVKWIFRYIKGTSGSSLCYIIRDLKLEGFTDANIARDADNRKSTADFKFTLDNIAIS